MNKIIRWGILGTGNIAGQFARGLREVSDAELVAVGSRSVQKARQFGREFSLRAGRCYGSYAALAEDEGVDVVYIATPHPLHLDNMLLCLRAGKPVLCEKPLTINVRQALAAVSMAERKDLFLMEALWTRFLPPIVRLRQRLSEGAIGEVRTVAADFGFKADWDPRSRLFDPNLGGGCLLDVGVYPISLAVMAMGPARDVSGFAHIGSTGVDEAAVFTLRCERGGLASLYASIREQTPNEAAVVGTEGYVRLHPTWWKGGPMTVRVGDVRREENLPVAGNGYQYEADEVCRCLREGRTQSDIMPLDDSLAVLGAMDRLRALWGVRYPMEMAEKVLT